MSVADRDEGTSFRAGASGHLATLEQKLKAAGVDAASSDMAALINDVEISDRLRRLLKPSDSN